MSLITLQNPNSSLTNHNFSLSSSLDFIRCRPLVKLKWLPPSSGFEDKHANRSSVGNGHELVIVRAGQPVSFECNAGAQPQPRIRWFKLSQQQHQNEGSARHRQLLAEFPALFQQGDNNSNNQAKLSQLKFDEAQIRSGLLQMDAIPNLVESFNRFEITSSGVQSKGEFKWSRRVTHLGAGDSTQRNNSKLKSNLPDQSQPSNF